MIQIKDENEQWVEVATIDDVNVGQVYRVSVGNPQNPGWQEQTKQAPIVQLDVFTTNNESVTINGNPTEGYESVYYGVSGDSANMSFDIVDDQGVLQTQLDGVALGYPPVLALPVLKVVDGSNSNIVDEVYFSTTLVAGVITTTGSFPASGNWKLLASRINAALGELGADWTISKNDIAFRIHS